MLGSGFLDKDGQKLDFEKLQQFVVDEEGLAQFLLKITEETDYCICFEVYEVSAWKEDPKTKRYTVPCDVELYLTATIKWDGCSHFWFGEEEDGKQDGYIHLCGKCCFDKHVKLIQELFEFGSKRIKRFDHEVAQ